MIKIMKKYYLFLAILVVMLIFPFEKSHAQSATHNVTMSTVVQASLAMDITSGDTVAFGNLTPGTPIAAPNTGTIVSVQTNASNGYTLAVSDAINGVDSCLLHTDAVTRITDVTSGTVALPAVWGASTGLGIAMFAADTNKEAKWGGGATYDDALNRYAAIPELATVAHTVTGLVAGANTSSWAYKLDAPASQKTGNYSGQMTFTATAVLP